jgi:DUF2934 family protein
MEKDSGVTTEAADSKARDAAFEQLLRLVGSYASAQTASANGSRAEVQKSPISKDVELRAYHIYLGRGATHGHDLDDWLQAERQVMAGLKKSKDSLRLALAFGVLRET